MAEMNACHAEPRSEAGPSTAQFGHAFGTCSVNASARAAQSDSNNACANTTVLALPVNIVLAAF